MSVALTAAPGVAHASGTFSLPGGPTVHRLGFGAMQITGKGVWGPPANHDEAIRVLRRCVDLGINLIDTADAYGPFVSEDLIAEALYPYPEGLVIATKGGLTRQGPSQWKAVGRPEYLHQCVEMSLRRLRLERIDLWQLHRLDARVPRDEQFGFMKEMVDAGKVRCVGLSEVSVEEIEAARTAGLTVATVQNRYNLGERQHDDVLDHCEREGIGFIPWYPLNTGKLLREDSHGPLADAAETLGATAAQVALAWLLRRSPVMLPIPGTSKVAHLEENTAAAALTLPDDLYAALTDADGGR
jgi:pyridoxine 4-dehydrogenase